MARPSAVIMLKREDPMSTSNLIASPANNKSAPRRRHVRPAFTVERVEHITVANDNSDNAVTRLADLVTALNQRLDTVVQTIDQRLGVVEELQDTERSRLIAALRGRSVNGLDRSAT
jgi:hypothetical protein